MRTCECTKLGGTFVELGIKQLTQESRPNYHSPRGLDSHARGRNAQYGDTTRTGSALNYSRTHTNILQTPQTPTGGETRSNTKF